MTVRATGWQQAMYDDLVFMGPCLAPDEPQADTPDGRFSLRALDRDLAGNGWDDTNRVYRRSAAVELIPDYVVPLAKMTAPVAGVVIAWLHGRAGRRVKFRVGDVVIEARTREDVEALVARVNEVRVRKPTPKKSGASSKGTKGEG